MQPHTAERPCPICQGHDKLPKHRGIRCFGFISEDGDYAHCTRDELAGPLEQHPSARTYAHRLTGDCKCGTSHGERAEVHDIGKARRARTVAEYDYTDETGAVLFRVVRKEPKAFLQQHPDGAGGWQWGRGDARLVPYKLPELIAAVAAGDTVHIVEGEKDVHAIRSRDGVATCNAGGAGKWSADFARYFDGAHVVIVADRDEPGLDHARSVWKSLRKVAASIRVVEAAHGKDATDHIEAGGTLDSFVPRWPIDDLQAHDPVMWKRAVLRQSLEPRDEPIQQVDIAKATRTPVSPSWPTGLDGAPDLLTSFRGVTFLVGGPSAGKSWLAIASGICAAHAGWHVLYLASEMSPSQVVRRAHAYTQTGFLPDTFEVHEVGYGATVETLVDSIAERATTRHMLIVLDSISSFVDQARVVESAEDVHRIGPLKRLTMWAMNVRRETNGKVSFLVLSERNAAGETKGRFGDHKADLVVSIESDKDAPMTKHIAVTKAWDGPVGPIGEYGLDPSKALLKRIDGE